MMAAIHLGTAQNKLCDILHYKLEWGLGGSSYPLKLYAADSSASKSALLLRLKSPETLQRRPPHPKQNMFTGVLWNSVDKKRY
jgi:hypothetical protein